MGITTSAQTGVDAKGEGFESDGLHTMAIME
jgi:hypothetical protein